MGKPVSVGDAVRKGNGRYSFGQSLYLIVKGKSALWEHQFRQGGKLKTKCYGSATGVAPVGLTKARTLVMADCVERREGRQVASNAKYHGNGNHAPTVITPFSVARDKYFADMQSGAEPKWTADQFETLTRMMLKHTEAIESRPIGQITLVEIADMLRPIWKGPGSHTGNRVRAITEKIIRSAGIKNDDNPALWENLDGKLSDKVAPSKHRASLPYAEVPALMGELAKDARVQARAVRFMILTGTRQDETLEATWAEIDLASRTWTIPGGERKDGGRMKMKDPHVVPLTDAAIAVLKECTPGTGNALVFPSKLGGRMSQQTTRECSREHCPDLELTVHGFRSSLTTWGEDQRDESGRALYDRNVVKACIAHYEGDENDRAYLRSKFFEPRKIVMDDWSRAVTS